MTQLLRGCPDHGRLSRYDWLPENVPSPASHAAPGVTPAGKCPYVDSDSGRIIVLFPVLPIPQLNFLRVQKNTCLPRAAGKQVLRETHFGDQAWAPARPGMMTRSPRTSEGPAAGVAGRGRRWLSHWPRDLQALLLSTKRSERFCLAIFCIKNIGDNVSFMHI